MTSYAATVPVKFEYPRHRVYEALCDLGHYPEWNTGMTSISTTSRMEPGLKYVTTSDVHGLVNRSEIEVVQLVPDEAIVLESKTGLITFRAVFELEEHSADSCSVICNLKFSFSNAIFKIAHSAVESMTEMRIRTDLEKLRVSLAGKSRQGG
jgi:ribosome-associated toxin RatA of RatAB toxin-antitoxin module